MQKKDSDLNKLKDINIKQEALIVNLNIMIYNLQKEAQKFNYKIYPPNTTRSKTPETVLYKKKSVNNNNGNSSQSKHFIL